MPNTIANVVAGKPLATGGVLIANLGSALPTSVATTLDVAFRGAGFIGDEGVTEATERSTDKIRAWGGSTVKVVQSDFSVTYAFTFIEALNVDVLKAVYGDDNVTTTAATATTGTLAAVKINNKTLPHKSFVFEVRDGNAKVRIVVPDGQITEVGEVTYTDDGVVGYAVTVEAFVDASGNNAYKYSDDGRFSGA